MKNIGRFCHRRDKNLSPQRDKDCTERGSLRRIRGRRTVSFHIFPDSLDGPHLLRQRNEYLRKTIRFLERVENESVAQWKHSKCHETDKHTSIAGFKNRTAYQTNLGIDDHIALYLRI